MYVIIVVSKGEQKSAVRQDLPCRANHPAFIVPGIRTGEKENRKGAAETQRSFVLPAGGKRL